MSDLYFKPGRTYYRVSKYDAEAEDWTCHASRVTKWGLRRAIRNLQNDGYEWDTSILVERVHPPWTMLDSRPYHPGRTRT